LRVVRRCGRCLPRWRRPKCPSRAIATELNKRRIPTPAGGRWQAVRLRRVNRVGAESPSDRALAFRHAGPQYWAVERRGRISPRTGRRQCQSFISILIRCSFGKTRRRHLSAPDAGMRCGLPGSSHQCDHCLGWSFTYADAWIRRSRGARTRAAVTEMAPTEAWCIRFLGGGNRANPNRSGQTVVTQLAHEGSPPPGLRPLRRSCDAIPIR
jgi:hypothetical protein